MKLIIAFVFVFFASAICQEFQTYDQLFADGLEAYWNENWKGSIAYFEKALQNYRYIQTCLYNCSRNCQNTTSNTVTVGYFYQFVLDKAICINSCEKEKFGDSRAVTRISDEVKKYIEDREIYKYLQFAYFRDGRYADSVAATHTYYLYDPDDKMMQANIEYYKNNENTTSDMYINLEQVIHMKLYDQGVDAFNRENYLDAVSNFEQALEALYVAEEKCRAVCEAEFDIGSEYPETQPTYHQHFVDYYVSVLECSMSCPMEVARVSKTVVANNFLPKLYNYLQFAYGKVKRDEERAKACKSYLLFHPTNKKVQSVLEQLSDYKSSGAFKEAVRLKERLDLQRELLQYIYQNFGIAQSESLDLQPYSSEDRDVLPSNEESTDNEERKAESVDEKLPQEAENSNDQEYTSTKHKIDDIILSKDQHNDQMEKLRKKREKEDDSDIVSLQDTPVGRATVDSRDIITIGAGPPSHPSAAEGPVLYEHTTMLANSTQMLGPLRFAMDGFATQNECEELIDLELAGGLSGDGYRGHASPHTRHENFQGLTVHRAAKLVEEGQLPLHSAQLYYDLSERVRLQVKAYFKLKEELYFDYTHLVCRTALDGDGDGDDRIDLSHPVHGDNCLLNKDGSCVKKKPAFVWRDYSAIMYLNSGFDGGEFIMTDSTARRVVLQVQPKCGRMVSFCAGKECLHGVKPVTRGRRCAMALWFTLDPSHDEQLRFEAKGILDRLSRKDEL